MYTQLCRCLSWSVLLVKLSTLSDRMGNTQGMRLRMAPPMKASSNMYSSDALAAGDCTAALAVAAGTLPLPAVGLSISLIVPLPKSTEKYCLCGG